MIINKGALSFKSEPSCIGFNVSRSVVKYYGVRFENSVWTEGRVICHEVGLAIEVKQCGDVEEEGEVVWLIG